MIKLEISGENTSDFAAQLTAVAQLMAGVTPAAPAEAPGKSAGRGRTKTGTADTATGAAGSTASQTSGTATAGTTEDTSTSTEAVTRESVGAKCALYGNPQKGGLAALKELFIEMGSPNGKWSEITDDKLVALNARLDGLLA